MTSPNIPPWDMKTEIVVKTEVDTNPKYGTPPQERSLSQHIQYGIINVDKPSGPSSHEVTAWAKKILNVGHAGHGGTLEN